MKPTNISFITPINEFKPFSLERQYSENLVLQDGSTINFASHNGPKESQEDSIAVTENQGYILLLVADGMGGLENGNEASYIVAKRIKEWLESQTSKKLSKLTPLKLKMNLFRLIHRIKEKELPKQSGTTLNMAIIGPEKTFIINVGDSRTYSIKNNEIKLLTRDDSLAFDLFKPKNVEERDGLRFFKDLNLITRSIEKYYPLVLKITSIDNQEYDVLCHMTDGISDILSEELIKQNILTQNPAQSLVSESISSDIIYGGVISEDFSPCIVPHDNASAIVYTKKKIKNN